MTVSKWSKQSPSWGSGYRAQRNFYAYLVTLAMTDGREVCPSCDGPLTVPEVDRAIPALDYRPGNVCYLCSACNQGRAALQSVGRDWRHVAAYVADVAAASETVKVPTLSEAAAWWQARKRGGGPASKYA